MPAVRCKRARCSLALLTAGLGIVEGIDALLEKEASQSSRSVLERLLAGVREGKRLPAVLAGQPDLLPPSLHRHRARGRKRGA